MVQLIPNNNNPVQKEIDAYVSEMVNTNNHEILNVTVREIKSKKSVGAFVHPAEEYFVNAVFKCVNMKIFNIMLQSMSKA